MKLQVVSGNLVTVSGNYGQYLGIFGQCMDSIWSINPRSVILGQPYSLPCHMTPTKKIYKKLKNEK